MLKIQLAADLAATALMAGTARAQTATPLQPAGPGSGDDEDAVKRHARFSALRDRCLRRPRRAVARAD
jgi:hypothetical protein